MDATEDALTLGKQFFDAISRGDRAGAQALLAVNAAQTTPFDEDDVTGHEAMIADIWSYRNSFPDLQFEISGGFVCGDHAAVQCTATGTYEPCTYGADAKKVIWRGCAIIQARDGKVDRLDMYLDWLLPVEQLGAIAGNPTFRS